MDLQFPHHESEIAQSTICNGTAPVRYWIHNNMITIGGRKMGKSYNNVIKLTELFSGDHPLLDKAYSPMTIRFFILQTHYRSTLDFSNEALGAAEKGLKRLMEAYSWLQQADLTALPVATKPSTLSAARLEGDEQPGEKVLRLLNEFDVFIADDFSTAKVLANMFELVPVINSLKDGSLNPAEIPLSTLEQLKARLKVYVEDIFGLKIEAGAEVEKLKGVMDVLIGLRKEARAKKDWLTSDTIRNKLAEVGIALKDEKNGEMTWNLD
jgi:cysteinyl-tRNA synthetase